MLITMRHRLLTLGSIAVLALGLARPAFAHDDLHAQISAVSRELAARPADATLYLRRGELYRAHHEPDKALADYEHALLLTPSLDAVRLARGRLLTETGRPDAALADLDLFLDSHSKHGEASLVRARARAALGRTDAAVQDYDAVLAGQPNPEWYVERARVLSRAGPSGLDRAISGLDEGLARLGPVVALESEALDLELASGRHAAALRRLDRLVAASPSPATWLARRGDTLRAIGRTAEARLSYQQGLDALAVLPASKQRTRSNQALAATLRIALDEGIALGSGGSR